MARISGIIIPDNKKIKVALTYIYGLGKNNSALILDSAKIDPEKRTKDLSPEEINKIQGIIERNYKTEGNLRREITGNIQRLKGIGSWRGTRHLRKLPVHGRTKVNARTLRGIRKTMGSGRKPATEKK